MTTNAYRQALRQVEDLTTEEQLQLIEELKKKIRQASQKKTKPRHSIKELKGLGKELWQTVDVDQYIAEERASWDG
jgi:hypothetical protein